MGKTLIAAARLFSRSIWVAALAACGAPPPAVPSLGPPVRAARPLEVVGDPAPPKVARPIEAPEAEPADGGEGAKVGSKAPLVGPELAAARGQVAIVHVFASWCAPCARMLPALQRVHAKYKGQTIVVVGISVDEEEQDARDFVRTTGVKFPFVWDGDKSIVGKWMPQRMPTTYVLDRAGVVRYLHSGYDDGQAAVVLREAEAL